MGFFDKVSKVASGTISAIDKGAKLVAEKATDEILMKQLADKPDNRYLIAEAKKRGLK